MSQPPSGTVTFLFTDIEGSTRLAAAQPYSWAAARKRHHAILRSHIEAKGGHIFQIIGDAFCAAFATADGALAAAAAAQRELHAERWEAGPVRVRMGVHSGTAEWRGGDYEGYLTLAHVQRIMAAAHGGQVLLSQATRTLMAGMPPGMDLRPLGAHRLKDFPASETIYQLTVPGLPAEFPPIRTMDVRRHNLPAPTTSFIGREHESAEVELLLQSNRLVTLIGAGGAGKTRLAIRVGAEALTAYPDGAWFVDLAPRTDPALVPQSIAAALGIGEERGRPLTATLVDYLRERRALLILDNCEHLIEASAQTVSALMAGCRQVTFLATSREALNIDGEVIYRVPSLSLPADNLPVTAERSEAVRLFIERAQAVQPAFELTPGNRDAVVQISRRLDGMPLALELAAVRIKVLSVEEIAARLDDRFRLLTGGGRTTVPRQQTLRATINWSYGLLSDAERVLYRRLAVFAGGWTISAAESVSSGAPLISADVLDLLARLVDKSLVITDSRDAETRYRMLETIRQFALEKLDAADERARLRDAHLSFFTTLAELAEPGLVRPDQLIWLNRLEADNDNVRAALDWATQGGDVQTGLRLAGALLEFWFNRDYFTEGTTYLDALLKASAGMPPTRERAKALNVAAHIHAWTLNDAIAATRLGQEALNTSRALGDEQNVAHAWMVLGAAAYGSGDVAAGIARLEESIKRFQALDCPDLLGDAYVHLGTALLEGGQIDASADAFSAAITQFHSIGHANKLAGAWRYLGYCRLANGALSEAASLCRQSLVLNTDLLSRTGVVACIALMGMIAAAGSNLRRGVRLLSAAENIRQSIHTSLYIHDAYESRRHQTRLQDIMGPLDFKAAWAEGAAMTMDAAAAEAIACAEDIEAGPGA